MIFNTRQLLLYFGLLLCVLLQVCRSKAPKLCPNFCNCDLYNGRNRAVCIAKRLINANIEMPKEVEILDLSYNDITIIDGDCVQEFVHLINLTLAHNAIHTIYPDAFSRLHSLQALDLSYNRLEYVDEHLLESNQQLNYANFEGNKFMTLPNGPILRSITLRVLNLRNTQINQVHSQLFSAMPYLRELDLAQNMLITLSSVAFNALKILNKLNLNENPLNCDKPLMRMLKIMINRGVEIFVQDCFIGNSKEILIEQQEQPMFERMELEGSERIIETQTTTAVTDLFHIWRTLPEGNDEVKVKSLQNRTICDGENAKLCRHYHACLEHVNHIRIEKENNLEKSNEKLYTEDDLKLAFVIGGATSTCLVVLMITCVLCAKSCLQLKRKNSVTEREQQISTSNRTSTSYAYRDMQPQPVQAIRSPRHSHTYRNERAIARQPYGPQDNFIARLFGRPARSQYYHSFNQNTATLIRRLSRSNLFINRSAVRESIQRQTSSQFHTVDQAGAERSSTLAPHTLNEPTSSWLMRPETPPPNYGDIVINNCDIK